MSSTALRLCVSAFKSVKGGKRRMRVDIAKETPALTVNKKLMSSLPIPISL